jgi:hypothetical protein
MRINDIENRPEYFKSLGLDLIVNSITVRAKIEQYSYKNQGIMTIDNGYIYISTDKGVKSVKIDIEIKDFLKILNERKKYIDDKIIEEKKLKINNL